MPTLTELLEAGAHFGHKKEKSFPRAKQFTYTIRDNVYVIDLEKTIAQLEKAIAFLKKEIAAGKTVLFLGTKSQAKETVKKIAEELGQPYMVDRWPGGMLTNFETIRKSLKTLSDLEEKIKSPEFAAEFTKKERLRIEEKVAKLNSVFEGIKELKKLPDVLFVVDVHKEAVATREARKMNLPVVGICDTNANPDLIDIPIPANDDSENTIKLLLSKIKEGAAQTPSEDSVRRRALPGGASKAAKDEKEPAKKEKK